ncbi:hypothetical protein Fmac_021796 [Flemingia macrophylla]|uniref:Uncharacterized protein n=1 Tax=Flemingia macrophylla TaxID=520843 RepID=A0ABD1LXW7_9FABA
MYGYRVKGSRGSQMKSDANDGVGSLGVVIRSLQGSIASGEAEPAGARHHR